jgi:hypothetical protein
MKTNVLKTCSVKLKIKKKKLANKFLDDFVAGMDKFIDVKCPGLGTHYLYD